jgi:8-oxo-dGTP pyrophosphatase MutT (NUDIX family)
MQTDQIPKTPKTRRLSCGVVVVRHTDAGPVFLMLRAFTNWDFPKGMQEPGENAKLTALREVEEETTLSDLIFPWGDSSIDTGPYSRNKTARYFIGVTRQEAISLPVNEELGRAEHQEWRWVPLNEARDLAPPRLQRVLDWAEDIIAA